MHYSANGDLITRVDIFLDKIKKGKAMKTCPTCKGKKKVEVTVVTVGSKNPDEKILMNCHVCDGAGQVSDQKLIAIQKAEKLWCRCKESTFGSYPQDGECNCGVYKHHVHCGKCGKISQIG